MDGDAQLRQPGSRGGLHEATRDLHHACEAHPVGQRMVGGSISREHWAYWLRAMLTLHMAVDEKLPQSLCRVSALRADLSVLPPVPVSRAASDFAYTNAWSDERAAGAAYVLHGAHCSGGRVLAPKMAKRGLPTLHTCYIDPTEVMSLVSRLRDREDLAFHARATFACLLGVMDEIDA